MSKQLNLWKQETGEESFKKFIMSILGNEEEYKEERLRAHATTIYRNYEQSHNQKHFRENKFASGAVVIASCALILLSRYFDLREKVQRPLEYMALASIVIFGVGFLYSLYQENEYKVSDKREKMALASIVIFGVGFLYSLYQENEYKVSDKREKYESDYAKHKELPEIQTIMDELKAETLGENKQRS